MRVPVAWVREHCDAGIAPDRLAERLAMTGTEVERVEHIGVATENGNTRLFKVGRVVTVKSHPNADRLKVCEVDLGESGPRSVVCGAPNVREGLTVAMALPGAVMVSGDKLKKAAIRGVESEGMILSEEELGLGANAAGIVELPDSYTVGEELGRYVAVADDVLELEITPNRPDCLSVYGVAREVHAATGAPLAPDPADGDAKATGPQPVEELVSVEVECPDLCSRFSARCFVDVRVGESPLWLKARLIAAGQRPINNVVDITNYVMLEIGQPMHAYDLDRVAGSKLVVRRARDGETLVTLDGELRAFDSDAVLVCDESGPSGIGGVMGGAASEVTSETARVLMEAATWNGPNILTTSSKLTLRTEASGRFEKQLHPALALRAQRLAARLMVELCDAKMAPGTIDVSVDEPKSHRIKLHPERVEKLLGEAVGAEEIEEILERLGYSLTGEKGAVVVDVPFFRHFDVSREADLIEEVSRIHGLDRLPVTIPALEQAVGGLTRTQQLRRRAEDALRDRGLVEVVAWSFVGSDFCDRLRLPRDDERRRVLGLANPLSADQSVMRTTLLPGLLDIVQRNFAAHADEVRLFESARVYLSEGQDKLPTEHHHLGVLLAGCYTPKTWRSDSRLPDFYLAKSILVSLLDDLRVPWRLAVGGPAFLHPGRAAEVLCGAHDAGWIGEVHPLVARDWDLEEPPVGFELDLDSVLSQVPGDVRFEDVITYPAVYQDMAVVVDQEVEAQAVIEVIRIGGGENLRSVSLFDLYRGDQIEAGKKSLALRLEFRSPEKTLTDAEVGKSRSRITSTLKRELGAVLRA